MLTLFGKDYVIDHCVSVLNAKQRNEVYKVYVTETLRAIAKRAGYEVLESYTEVMQRLEKSAVEETRSSEDIIGNIQSKIEALQ